MNQRRESTDDAPRFSGVPSRQHDELEQFESEYSLERISQRVPLREIATVFWIVILLSTLTAGRLSDTPPTQFMTDLRVVMIAVSVLVCLFLLTYAQRLDAKQTRAAVIVIAGLALAVEFALSFYGPAALGGFSVALIAIPIYAAQLLNARQMTVMLLVITVLAGIVVYYNYGADYAPYLLSQTSLLVIVVWAVAYSVYLLNADRIEALNQAERAAFTDVRTGLPNSRFLRRRAEAVLDEFGENPPGQLGIVVLDLDGFRTANLLRGHRDGDRILVSVANAISEAASEGEIVARTGGDEFSVLIPSTSKRELEAVSNHFRSAVHEALDASPTSGGLIDVSIGTARCSSKVSDFDSLVAAADQALYLEKSMHERSPERRLVGIPLEGDALVGRTDPPPQQPRRTIGARSRWENLRWSTRSVEAKYITIAWALSALAVAVSMRMPDAVEHNDLIVSLIVGFGLFMAIVTYPRRPSEDLIRQLFDVFLGIFALAITIWFTGKNASPAVAAGLLLLIYIGWFVPLKAVVPMWCFTILIPLVPMLFGQEEEFRIMDIVTVVGGVTVSAVMLRVLMSNRRYIERADSLTRQLSSLDPRSGAYSRRAFEMRMADDLDRLSYADRDALAVVMVDLGEFKRITADFGRDAADQLLTTVTGVLAEASREYDCIARLGGDEFAVVAPGVDAESARALAVRLVGAIRESGEVKSLPCGHLVRPSAGFALYGMHGRTTDELMAAAETALTAAKTTGRDPNRVSSFVVSL